MLTRNRLLLAIMILFVCVASPVSAWVYDAGAVQSAGVSVKGDSNCKWVAAPFTVEYDCYATTFGAALARAVGPKDAGFDVYLSTTLFGVPGSEIAKLPQKLVPLDAKYTYYDASLSAPVFLKAGTIYSLILIPTSPSLWASVSWGNKSGTYIGWGTSDYGKSWYQLSAPICVRVDGNVVPEPSSMVALIFAILGTGILRKKVL